MNEDAIRAETQLTRLYIGTIREVNASSIVVAVDPSISKLTIVDGTQTYDVGQFGSIVKIPFGNRTIYGLVNRVRVPSEAEELHGVSQGRLTENRILEVDLFGESSQDCAAENTKPTSFQRGLSLHPLPYQKVYLATLEELREIFSGDTSSSILLGEHVGVHGVPCYASMNHIVGKHTAVLGSTGTGKSGAVAAMIHSILEWGDQHGQVPWRPQIVILDPHNEYGSAFSNHKRLATDEGSLKLPYWLLDFEETVNLLTGKSSFVVTSQANIIKNALLRERLTGAESLGLVTDRLTIDSPVPYALGNPSGLDVFGERQGWRDDKGLVGAINSQRPENKNKKDHEEYNRIIRRIETLMNDERVSFLMSPCESTSDPMPEILEQLIGGCSPVKVVDLSGVPDEVAAIASAAIARMLFLMKVWQSPEDRALSPVMLVCEEAHRYVPNSGEAQYSAAQDAIRRIAKEGRKYGLGLVLVTQRPSELEATVLSQCNSWLVLRVTNETDREYVRSMLPDSMSALAKMLSGLRRREALFVGEAATVPSRIRIRELRIDELPKSHDIDFESGWRNLGPSQQFLEQAVQRWRYQKR